ncbi:Pescadillo [Gracilaria domingensis]|nr:Pescadillo [Gracilaria domingensis]
MGREKKKGTSGNAKAFISRDKALKKLQLSIPEFRRLCILKGIYPREPRKKFEGSDKTYYLRKDIDFLAHERLINTIRQQNAHRKKVVKARSKRRIDVLRRLALNAPRSRLDHLVLERYPNFVDAIRDLDDPLCIMALFANLPADHKVGIAPERIAKSQRLLREFHNFVVQTNALGKVFVSIKGYYFQANVMGENVTWIAPHRFSQILPDDVDYSVMLNFLELYECIMSFVNFRLYTSQNLAYPPKILRNADANGMELSSLLIERASGPASERRGDTQPKEKEVASAIAPDAIKIVEELAMKSKAEDESDDEGSDTGPDGHDDNRENEGNEVEYGLENNDSGVFSGKSIVLGREVPYVELEFCLKAAGAVSVTREDDLPGGENRLSGYSYWIIDRPRVQGDRDMSLEYVQPQYVFDSINASMLLPTLLYGPGAPLPPHLSPFVTEDDDGGYRPWFKDIIDRIKAGDTSVVEEAAAVVYADRDAKSQQKLAKNHGNTLKEGNIEIQSSSDGYRSKMDESIDGGKQVDGIGQDRANEVGSGQIGDGDTMTEDAEEIQSEGEDIEDEEGQEEELSKAKKARMDKEGREMATLMLSRKKMRQYQRHKKAENEKVVAKEKLVQKRKRLEAARAEQGAEKLKRRRQL